MALAGATTEHTEGHGNCLWGAKPARANPKRCILFRQEVRGRLFRETPCVPWSGPGLLCVRVRSLSANWSQSTGRAHSRVFRGRDCRVRLGISVHWRQLAVWFRGEEGLDMAVELLDLRGEGVGGSFLAEERQELADGVVD